MITTTILIVDASATPHHAALVRRSGDRLEYLYRDKLYATEAVSYHDNRGEPVVIGANGHASNINGENRGAESNSNVNDGTEADSIVEGNLHRPLFAPGALRSFIARVGEPWDDAILVLPPDGCLSAHVAVPFRERKLLRTLATQALYDEVPFDVDEFFFTVTPLAKSGSNLTDVHIAGLPRQTLARLLAECREGGFEPAIVTTPAAVLTGVLGWQAVREEVANVAIVLFTHQYVAQLCVVDGAPKVERSLPLFSYVTREELLSDVALSVLAVERSYATTLSRVLVIDVTDNQSLYQATLTKLATLLGPEREVLPVSPGAEAGENSWTVLKCAALTATTNPPARLLTNFRTFDFSYSPQLREIIRGVSALLPWGGAMLGILCLVLVALYGFREWEIYRLQQANSSLLQELFPELDSADGNEATALQSESRRLEEELRLFGSATRSTPLDALSELAKDLPQASGTTLKRFRVQGARMNIDGSAPDYSAVEALERALKKRKSVYCRVKKETSAPTFNQGPGRVFSLEVILCE